MTDRPEYYNDRKTKYERIIHAEENAMIFAREPLKGYTLYTWPFMPCERCTLHMIQAGIRHFVFPSPTEDALTRWREHFTTAFHYIFECGATWTEILRGDIEK